MADEQTGAAPSAAVEAPPVSAPAERPVDLDAPVTEPQSRETVNGSADRMRDAVGKFIAKESAPAGEPDASPEAVPGEEQGGDPASEPSIDPPRSWSKEDKEIFAGLPRETQARLAEREQSRESDFLRRQNEAAEKTKGLTAKETAVEQVRQWHEQSALQNLEAIKRYEAGTFADIKTPQDAQKLASEDFIRYTEYKAFQDVKAAQENEVRQLQQQRQQEAQTQFVTWSGEQDRKFTEQFKEFSDPKRAGELRDTVILPYITDVLGIKQSDLPMLWSNPFFRGHEMQRAIYDAARFEAARRKATAAVPKAVPQPQRPGNAGAQGNASDLASIAASGDMAAYVAARKKASA